MFCHFEARECLKSLDISEKRYFGSPRMTLSLRLCNMSICSSYQVFCHFEAGPRCLFRESQNDTFT